jgi:DNA-binding transcriptional ArsR family regulator
MLEMLRRQSLTPSELAQPFRMAHGTIAEHIRALRTAGLVDFRVRRNQHVYSLIRAQLRPVDEWIGRFSRSAELRADTASSR